MKVVSFLPPVGIWDIALLIVVWIQATVLSYLFEPKWKAFLFLFPFPFTFSTLAVGTGVDITPVIGAVLLLLFLHGVRLLYYSRGLSITASIAVAAVFYSLTSTLLVKVLPRTDAAFWTAFGCVYGLGVVLYFVTPYRDEPGHKSSLPLMRKLPVVSGVILLLIVLKGIMQGFITMFPMMGLVTVYEGRHSLWTICRQMPVLLLLIMPIMAVCKLAQSTLGLGLCLALGWGVFLLLLFPVVSLRSRLDRRQAEAAGG